jgi:hypothetical protein
MGQVVPSFLRERFDVSTHDHYREICAAASIGQATPEELFELEQHAAVCKSCQEEYFDYLNLAAERFAAANEKPTLSTEAAQESLDSDLLTRRFFERAEREGIPFSSAVGTEARQLAPAKKPFSKRVPWRVPVQAIAAAVLLVLGLSGGYFYGSRATRPSVASESPAQSEQEAAAPGLEWHIAELTTTNARLGAEIDRLKNDLSKADVELQATRKDLRSTSEDREKLLEVRTSLDVRLRTVEAALADSRALVISAQQDTRKHQERASELEAALLSDKSKIDDLTAELGEKSAALDKERELLALGHDVSDLMGARNLHIVDVVDTDPRGKTQPAFGRIFFTEGKSLVFYAYDLNDTKLQRANYQYRVWAKQEGGDKQVRSLGIFYSDDKAQRRWVFKCNDPKVLNVIDSVFVTLEKPDSDPSGPKGQNLMYAYLRGQPNHP